MLYASLHGALTKFLVTCSLILHTRSIFVTLWVNSIDKRQFHPFIKGESVILSRNRCYGLRTLITALSLLGELVDKYSRRICFSCFIFRSRREAKMEK